MPLRASRSVFLQSGNSARASEPAEFKRLLQAKNAFCNRIIVGVAFKAYRELKAGLSQALAVAKGGVLVAAVAV